MKYKWYEKDGHIFSEEVKIKENKDFRFADKFEHQVVIAYNVGRENAKYIVALHNATITE